MDRGVTLRYRTGEEQARVTLKLRDATTLRRVNFRSQPQPPADVQDLVRPTLGASLTPVVKTSAVLAAERC
jgi:hypothetical protein